MSSLGVLVIQLFDNFSQKECKNRGTGDNTKEIRDTECVNKCGSRLLYLCFVLLLWSFPSLCLFCSFPIILFLFCLLYCFILFFTLVNIYLHHRIPTLDLSHMKDKVLYIYTQRGVAGP